MAQVQKAVVMTVKGTSTFGRVVKARLVEATEDREPALKLAVECRNGESMVIFDSFRKDRKIGDLAYPKALCREFGCKTVDELPEAIVAAGSDYLVKQIVVQQRNDNGVLQEDEAGMPIMGNPQGRIELLF